MGRFIRAALTPPPLAALAAGLVGTLWLGSALALAGVALAIALVWRRANDTPSRVAQLLARAGLGRPGFEAGLRRLGADLARVRRPLDASRRAARAREQLTMAQERLLALHGVLIERFNPGELTFGRYLGAANEVHLSVLDRVRDAATQLAGLEGVDPEMLEAQVRQLRRRAERGEAQRAELEALEARQGAYAEALAAIDARLVANQDALNGLMQVTTALAQVRTREGQAVLDADAALEELQHLAARSQQYAVDAREAVLSRQR